MNARTYLVRTILLFSLLALSLPAAWAAPSSQYTVEVTAPPAGSVVRGPVTVIGTATHPDFWKYEIRVTTGSDPAAGDDHWYRVMVVEQQVVGGELAVWDTTAFPDGAHILRLRVVRRDGNWQDFDVPLTVANTTPLSPTPVPPTPTPAAVTETATPIAEPTAAPVDVGSTGPAPAPQVGSGRPVIYLTFDDGPTPYTLQILNVLARYDARATFFVVGRFAATYPDILRATAAGGHALANHTYSHRSLSGISFAQFEQEVTNTQQLLGAAGTRCLRAPYGYSDANTATFAARLGYRLVWWDIDTWDWQRGGVGNIAARATRNAFPGAIILMHDGGGERSQTVAALDIILRDLTARGYRFEALRC